MAWHDKDDDEGPMSVMKCMEALLVGTLLVGAAATALFGFVRFLFSLL